MIARENFISKLLDGNDKFFYIPVYQREYSWGISNCDTLLNDLKFLVKHELNSHFFGSIVYRPKDYGGVYSHCIIDGQQRLTTITLLLLAIYNTFKHFEMKTPGVLYENNISLDKLENSYFYIDPYSNCKELKLLLNESDNEKFKVLFETKDNKEIGLLTDVSKLTSNCNIFINYKFFYSELINMKIEDIISLYKAIKKLTIVNVTLEDNDDAQLIFESINSKMKELDECDKIRNYLFMQADYSEQTNLYNNYWKKINNNVPNTTKLFRFYLAIKQNEFVSEKKLYYFFKDFMEENPEYTYESILKETLKYSEFMCEMLMYSENSKYEYQRCIYRINKLDINTIYPLLFVCFDRFKNDLLSIDEMNEILSLIESYLTRRTFLKLPIGSLNKIFAFMPEEINKKMEKGFSFKDALIDIFMMKSGNTRFPRDEEFKDAFKNFELYNAKPAFKKYVLERLSNFNNKEIVDIDNLINNGKLTIEHIMPQHLSDDWKKYLGEKCEFIHTKYLNTIGNLTLTTYNSEYSDSLFLKKKTLRDKGFMYSNLYLNEFLKTCEDWTEIEILERSELLFNRALEIWKLPPIRSCERVFDLHDPNTWGIIPITQFAKVAFDYLLVNNLLTDSDITNLKDKEYSKQALGAYYPVLSSTRKPVGCKKSHWSIKEYKVNGHVLYLSFEWFENQFDKLCKYIKSKMNM